MACSATARRIRSAWAWLSAWNRRWYPGAERERQVARQFARRVGRRKSGFSALLKRPVASFGSRAPLKCPGNQSCSRQGRNGNKAADCHWANYSAFWCSALHRLERGQARASRAVAAFR